MTLISTKQKIASAIILIAVIAAGTVPTTIPTLRAQGRLPSQGGMDTSILSSPTPAPANALSPTAALAPDAPLPPGLMGDDQQDDMLPPLAGEIQQINNQDYYISPLNTFRIRVPVYPELGGQVNDTMNVVTFQDAFGDHSSIGCFPLDDAMRADMARRGRKNFLIWFFQTFIQADFQRNLPGTTAMPDARYDPKPQGGALFMQLLIPDGSAYMERVFLFPQKNPVIAKRGNLAFERDGFVYVLSTELTERVFEHATWKKTDAEEEKILTDRMYDLLSRMIFIKPKTTAPAPTAPANTLTPRAAPSPTSSAPTITSPAPATPGATAPAK